MMGDASGVSPEEIGAPKYQRIPFGKEMLKQFLFDPNYRNLNHGSFGAIPLPIHERAAQLRAECELRPDIFIRYTYPALLDKSRAAVAEVLNVPTETVVFVPNATTGVNTVLHNLPWNRDRKDEVLYFNIIYGSAGKTIEYIAEKRHDVFTPRVTQLHYPIEDDDFIAAFEGAIAKSRADGKRPRVAVFDTIASLPGVRVPFERLTATCRKEGLISVIDGAHGIGHIPLDLSALDPDFFVSNCHKWLSSPRGCAAFYVPVRNQPLIRSTLPTSHGFVPRPGRSSAVNPLPLSEKSQYVTMFEFVGTLDNTPYLVVPEAIKWRKEACGGEKAIYEYCSSLAKEGGAKVAEILGTEVLDNSTHTITNCALVNVRLPLVISNEKVEGTNVVRPGYGIKASRWLEKRLNEDYNSFIPVYYFQDTWWTRLSAQIYLDLEDFEWAGLTLKKLCERVGREEYLDPEEVAKSLQDVHIVTGGDLAEEGQEGLA